MRRLPPLGSLRAFEAAARHLSFQQAGAELCVTPTAVSHQVRALEEACGCPLFQRRPRPLTLTTAGQRLYPVVRDGLDAFAVTLASLSEDADQRSLRVTTPDAFAGRWLVPRLPRWQATHPDLPLEVIGTNAVADLRAGDADVAIRYGRAMPPGLAGEELFRDSFFPVCSPAVLARGTPIRSAADLLQHTLIHFDWFTAEPEAPILARWLATARAVDPELPEPEERQILRFREEIHAIEAVVAGQGIAVCSSVLVARELENGTLAQAHPLSLPGFGFYLAYVPSHPRKPLIETFAAWLRSVG